MDADLTLSKGLTARSATADDVAALTALIAACELDLDGEAEIDPGDVVMAFGRAGYDPERDCLLVFEGQDLVAWAEVCKSSSEADVHPAHRGRGIGAAVLAWTEAHGRELGATRLEQIVTDHDERAAELFRRAGYAQIDTSWVLEIRLDAGPPPEVDAPAGIRIRPWELGEDDPDVYRVIEDAFGEWPGRDPETYEEWRSRFVSHPSFAPELSPLAFDGDELVGATLYLDYADADEGWVQQLATKATHRHRGIARALLHRTFVIARERGKVRCGLSTNSRTGALALYEKVGMRVRRSYTRWSKTL